MKHHVTIRWKRLGRKRSGTNRNGRKERIDFLVIGPHEDLLTIVKRCKLKWYGHVSPSSGLAKTILQGTVKGGRKQGRQKKGGKTTSVNGQARSSPSPRGQWRIKKNGGNWL